MKFYVEIIKTKKGDKMPVLKVNLGYRDTIVSFDKLLISEITSKTIGELYSLNVGDKIYIGGDKR